MRAPFSRKHLSVVGLLRTARGVFAQIPCFCGTSKRVPRFNKVRCFTQSAVRTDSTNRWL